MGIFSKFCKKAKSPQKSSDKFKIVLTTEMNLSEKEKNAIISIVENGIEYNLSNSNIAIDIMLNLQMYDSIIIHRDNNGVEVILG